MPPHHHLHGLAAALNNTEHFAHRLLGYRVYVPFGVVALSLAAAACFGASSVLEQREAHRAPSHMAMRLGLIGHLLRRPLWLLGNLASIAGFGLQVLALRHGSLALVQPLMVTGLVFALGTAAALDHRRPSWHEVMWIALTMIGLGVFLSVARPGEGLAHGANAGWALLGAITVGSVVALAFTGRELPRWRALVLGVAAGIVGGVGSALIERSAHLLDHGIGSLLTSWAPYALILSFVVGLVLTQSAYQAGDIRLSLPALTVTEPIVAILIGQLLLSEKIALGPAAVVGEVLALGAMTLGVFGLGQTAGVTLEAGSEESEGEDPPANSGGESAGGYADHGAPASEARTH
jgi:drug/metabolite transporter (DMT)-like permease